MAVIVYYILGSLMRIAYYVLHYALNFVYWGKSKTVPPIKNLLLLKSAKDLAKEIRESKVKSETVVQTYIDRIKEVNPYINAVVRDRFREALKDAREVDTLVQSGKFTTQQLEDEKPLLGVPFTVKVLINVKGFPSTASSKLFRDAIAAEDAPSVNLIKKAGGIIIATTNAPEFGFSFETNNLIYGKTSNPYDITKTPGGSSGGEAALLGAGASVIGLGNDLTGSLRVPAHFTGLFSHKPTIGLVPSAGTFPVPPSEQACLVYNGRMCRYSEDLVTLMNILTSENVDRLEFNRKVNFSKLKIYYSTSCGDPFAMSVNKDIVKAMHEAILHFTKTYGATAKNVRVPLLNKANLMVIPCMVGLIPNHIKFLSLGKVEDINLLLEVFKFLLGRSTFSLQMIWMIFFIKLSPFTIKDAYQAQKDLKKLVENFEELLDENSVFIYPTFPVTAPYHHEIITLQLSTCYTSIFNFLGLPATSCPIGINGNGMPHGIQIIARKNNDPLTLACAIELEKVFGGWLPPGKLDLYVK